MDERFDYTYAAPTESERREIENIRKQYAEDKEEGIEKLRRLNKKATTPPMVAGAVMGAAGTLIAGLGMSMVMVWNLLIWGIFVGLAGIAVVVAAYPVYKRLLARNKRKYAAEITALSDKLLNK